MNDVHLHLLLNHIPTVGFGIGLALFVTALVGKSSDVMRAALAIFFLAEYSGMFLFAVLTAVLFLGGWHAGFPMNFDTGWGRWAGALVLVTIVFVCSLLARFATRRLERMHARG